MSFNSVISRNDASALIPEEVSRQILQDVPTSSAVMRLGRRLPNMSRKQFRMPVLDSLPNAYFVNGDTGLKQTSEQAWVNKYIDAEEMAVIIPIPEAVLDDADYDIWAEVRPRAAEAIGKLFDAAVLIGQNAPSAWPDDLLAACTAASHVVDLSTQIAAGEDLYDVIMGPTGLLSLIEVDGFRATGHLAAMAMAGKLRGLRDGVGQPIFKRSMSDGQNMQEATRYELDGAPVMFLDNGSVPAATALQFTGQWSELVWAVRQDITYKVLTEAVIQDTSGNIVYNLAQQDMVALRIVFRAGWQVPNPVKAMNTDEATRFPFAVLVP